MRSHRNRSPTIPVGCSKNLNVCKNEALPYRAKPGFSTLLSMILQRIRATHQIRHQ